jgi:hypothetical protein
METAEDLRLYTFYLKPLKEVNRWIETVLLPADRRNPR